MITSFSVKEREAVTHLFQLAGGLTSRILREEVMQSDFGRRQQSCQGVWLGGRGSGGRLILGIMRNTWFDVWIERNCKARGDRGVQNINCG